MTFFLHVHAETINISLSASLSPSINPQAVAARGDDYSRPGFHLAPDKVHFLQDQALALGGGPSVTAKCHITSRVTSASTLDVRMLAQINSRSR